MPPENNSKLFISEYTSEFVDRWDELVDREKRGDFKPAYDHYDPDFIIQVATK